MGITVVLKETVQYVTAEATAGNLEAIQFFKNVENMDIVRQTETYLVLEEIEPNEENSLN